MIRQQTLRARQKLMGKLPITGELLRGSLLERTVRHTKDCPKCLVAEEVSDLREDWMNHADAVLADETIVAVVYEALAKRHPKSRCRGRRGAPADMVLRLLVLKHIRNWSYEVLEREVRANLVYRDFTHVGGAKTPDAKTMGRWGVALGPEVPKQVHECVVRIARDKGVTAGRRMRVDTTVVETDIHHPTDSTLLGDGVRVLTRIMR